MKCDRCENQATIHEVTIRAGEKVERHLCEACARQLGVSVQQPADAATPLTSLLTQFVTVQTSAESARAQAMGQVQQCPACRLTFGSFKTDGKLGCPLCYRAFESQLSSILQRAHEGGTHHSGKFPRRLARISAAPDHPASRSQADSDAATDLTALAEKARRLASLRKHLTDAVAAEQYERAAQIRDELKQLQSELAAIAREHHADNPDNPESSA